MELKNALTVCLISFFSATMVLLIARALDLQAAARLEPQLTRIAEELELCASKEESGRTCQRTGRKRRSPKDWSCTIFTATPLPHLPQIESQAHEVVQSDFAAELKSGAVSWKMLNYEDSATADLAKKFEIQMPVVVLAKMQRGSAGGSGWIASGRWLETSPRTLPTCGTRSARFRPAESQPTSTSSNDQPKAEESDPKTVDIPVPADLPISE